ncbi:MAG: DUF92 domain-containing protein [Spirochaetota bacterium]
MTLVIIAVNILIASAAYRRRSLSRTGGAAGAMIGAGIWLAAGALFWGILAFFFVTSSVFSKLGTIRKERLKQLHAKHSVRDAVQVVANAGTALAAALLYGVTAHPVFASIFGATVAAATADTWASEIGFLSRSRPVSISTGRPVESGISGGITALGTIMAGSGALSVGVLFALGRTWSTGSLAAGVVTTVIITLAGFLASLVDSLLGSTLQVHYIIPDKGIITERAQVNGQLLPRHRGLSWITNDTVNALSGLFAAALAGGLHLLLLT